ncbi:MAG TPA: ATP-binding protein [Gaiellaceae bacterium]|nr:ATP-binding protein [Gaiellaceae bacterium]
MYEGTNPFRYGDLALDDAFADREAELAELAADMRNGQNVLVYAPRRYGKSSLVLRASGLAAERGVLVAYCDLMRTPTKERLAGALAKTIYEDLSSPSGELLERARSVFRGLRVRPTIEVDADTGGVSFSFEASRRAGGGDIDATIENLLELPQELAAERGRRAVLVLDEFQEVVKLDRRFPNLMRAVFQTQPEVGHVYLGSKRHVLDEIFADRNEPFWRSAKRLELGLIPPRAFGPFVRRRFDATDKGLTDGALARLLAVTGGHPYGTQQLAYAVWELVPVGHYAHEDDVETALAHVLRSEHNYFSTLWERATENQRLLMLALAAEPSRLYSKAYHDRHGLASASHVQRALGALVKEELVGRNEAGEYCIVEPFLAEWLLRERA